jgi:hypothetical protein
MSSDNIPNLLGPQDSGSPDEDSVVYHHEDPATEEHDEPDSDICVYHAPTNKGKTCHTAKNPTSTRNYCAYHEKEICVPHTHWKSTCGKCRILRRKQDASPARPVGKPAPTRAPMCTFKYIKGKTCPYLNYTNGKTCGKHVGRVCEHQENKFTCQRCNKKMLEVLKSTVVQSKRRCPFVYLDGEKCKLYTLTDGRACSSHNRSMCEHDVNRRTCETCHPPESESAEAEAEAEVAPAPEPRANYGDDVRKYYDEFLKFETFMEMKRKQYI